MARRTRDGFDKIKIILELFELAFVNFKRAHGTKFSISQENQSVFEQRLRKVVLDDVVSGSDLFDNELFVKAVDLFRRELAVIHALSSPYFMLAAEESAEKLDWSRSREHMPLSFSEIESYKKQGQETRIESMVSTSVEGRGKQVNEDVVWMRKIDSPLSPKVVREQLFLSLTKSAEVASENYGAKPLGATLTLAHIGQDKTLTTAQIGVGGCFVLTKRSGKWILENRLPVHTGEQENKRLTHFLSGAEDRQAGFRESSYWNDRLAESRAIGHRAHAQDGLRSYPTITQYQLSSDKEEQVVIVLCDGVMEQITGVDLCNIVTRWDETSSLHVLSGLADLICAAATWRGRDDRDRDDLTAVCMWPTAGNTAVVIDGSGIGAADVVSAALSSMTLLQPSSEAKAVVAVSVPSSYMPDKLADTFYASGSEGDFVWQVDNIESAEQDKKSSDRTWIMPVLLAALILSIISLIAGDVAEDGELDLFGAFPSSNDDTGSDLACVPQQGLVLCQALMAYLGSVGGVASNVVLSYVQAQAFLSFLEVGQYFTGAGFTKADLLHNVTLLGQQLSACTGSGVQEQLCAATAINGIAVSEQPTSPFFNCDVWSMAEDVRMPLAAFVNATHLALDNATSFILDLSNMGVFFSGFSSTGVVNVLTKDVAHTFIGGLPEFYGPAQIDFGAFNCPVEITPVVDPPLYFGSTIFSGFDCVDVTGLFQVTGSGEVLDHLRVSSFPVTMILALANGAGLSSGDQIPVDESGNFLVKACSGEDGIFSFFLNVCVRIQVQNAAGSAVLCHDRTQRVSVEFFGPTGPTTPDSTTDSGTMSFTTA